MSEPFDVVVLGSGLAASCLARLLRREVPSARVVTLDKNDGPRRKVGESTVEIGAHFLHSRLGLAEELARTQLPKNGLRFWFDDAQNALPFEEASEDGPATFSYWRSYQNDRATLEATLVAGNRAAGAEQLFGVRGLEVEARGGGPADPHRVRFRHGGAERRLAARWLVDATGIRSLLGRALGNLAPEERLPHSACWGWFRGARSVDALVRRSSASRRFTFGPRVLSTNHLMNEGYWIWLIPLADGTLSVGLAYDETVLTDAPRSAADFEAFLRRHRMARDVLEGATLEQFGQLRRYAFRPRRYATPERVAWVGVAGGFVDPHYSNGVDAIALSCEVTADLVRRDLAGEGIDAARLETYDRALRLLYEQGVVFFAGLYKTFVSQELSTIRYRRDTHVYWNLYTWAYLSGRLLDLDFLSGFLPLVEDALARGRFFSGLVQHAYERLAARGALRRGNRGRYVFNQLGWRTVPYIRFEQQLGHPPDLARCRRALEEIDAGSFLALVDAIFDGDRSPARRLLFEAADRSYPELLAAAERHGGFGDAFWADAFALLGRALEEGLAAGGVAVGPLPLDGPAWGRLRQRLEAACPDDDARRRLRRLYNAQPELTDFDDLPPSRDLVQARDAWSAAHTPWLDAAPDFQTVYDVLGEVWWRKPKRPLASLAASVTPPAS